jgi:GxxExxY protein
MHSTEELNHTTSGVIGAAIEVHRHLGPGLMESTYLVCLCEELRLRKISSQREVSIPISYKGKEVGCGYRIDLLVGEAIPVELKCVETVLPVHEAQLLTYLRLLNMRVGLLLNFNVPVLVKGIHRVVNSL